MKNQFYSKLVIHCSLFIAAFLILKSYCFAQNSISKLSDNTSSNLEYISETIQRISLSKRIFILSNNSNNLFKGDYITLLLEDKPVCRAMVIKPVQDQIGIKIIKIYSLSNWEKLNAGKDIKILKGDDAIIFSKAQEEKDNEEKDAEESGPKIASEEDLFNEKEILSDEIKSDEQDKRLIKTDNLLGFQFGVIQTLGETGDPKGQPHWALYYGRQIKDNIWGELHYGESSLYNFPGEGIGTKLTNITIKGLYTFNAPFDSYIRPYLGFQIIRADSPDAGTPDVEAGFTNPKELEKEKTIVKNMNSNSVIFGLNILKRLVPGWFLSLNLGTDLITGGFSLEF